MVQKMTINSPIPVFLRVSLNSMFLYHFISIIELLKCSVNSTLSVISSKYLGEGGGGKNQIGNDTI